MDGGFGTFTYSFALVFVGRADVHLAGHSTTGGHRMKTTRYALQWSDREDNWHTEPRRMDSLEELQGAMADHLALFPSIDVRAVRIVQEISPIPTDVLQLERLRNERQRQTTV